MTLLTRADPAGVPAPPPGRYSHVVRVDLGATAMLYVSGQVAFGDDGTIVGAGDLRRQSERVLELLTRILAAEGAGWPDVVNIRSYLTDMSRLAEYGAARAPYLAGHLPTSTTVGVSALFLPEALIEVELVAVIPTRTPTRIPS